MHEFACVYARVCWVFSLYAVVCVTAYLSILFFVQFSLGWLLSDRLVVVFQDGEVDEDNWKQFIRRCVLPISGIGYDRIEAVMNTLEQNSSIVHQAREARLSAPSPKEASPSPDVESGATTCFG